jgi:hypothetical protein
MKKTTKCSILEIKEAKTQFTVSKRKHILNTNINKAYLDKGNVVLHAESSDKLLVAGLITILAQNAQQSLTLIQSLGALTQATAQTISDKSLLEDLLDSGVDIHWSRRDSRCGGSDIISLYIRHVEFLDE